MTRTSDAVRPDWRLAILACSRRKAISRPAIAAVERYDGPAFRVLRRYRRDANALAADLPVRALILSAQFGLVAEQEQIPRYDRRLDDRQRARLVPGIRTEIQEVLRAGAPSEVLVCAGEDYIAALEDAIALLRQHSKVLIAPGPPGRQSAILHDWLYSRPPASLATTARGQIRLRGTDIRCSGEELISLARRHLRLGVGLTDVAVTRCYSWFVEIDGQRVAPKWLAALASGRPAKAFSTSDARRVLAQLGIAVSRCAVPSVVVHNIDAEPKVSPAS